MADAMDWKGSAGESWAAEWRRTDRSFGGLTEQLLRHTRDFAFNSVLDIGCGAGELSLAVARGRPEVAVVGVDISPDLVEAARERGQNLVNVSFELGDASRWRPEPEFQPDLLISRHGVMFFDDPVAAFAHLAGISAPNAGMVFSCFRGPAERNEIFSGIRGLLPAPDSPPDPHAPGPMAFADADRLRGILTQAGWGSIQFEPVDFAMVVGAGADPIEDAVEYFRAIGPVAQAAARMSAQEQAEFVGKLRAWLETRNIGGMIALGAIAWIVKARRT